MSLIDLPENPVPPGAVCGYVDTPDGASIRYARWPAAGGTIRGTVTLLHGRAEFIEKYFEVVADLRKRGFAVVAFDWRGQGGSNRQLRNPVRGHIRDFSRYRIDLETVIDSVSLADCPGPHFALAHSTGGAVLLSAAERLRTQIHRAVLCAPLIGLRDFGPKERLIYRVAAVLTWLGFGRAFIPTGNGVVTTTFEANKLTSDRVRFERMNAVLAAAPHLGVGSPTNGWLYAAARALRRFRHPDFGPSVRLPMLIVAAGNDRIVSTRAAEDLATRTKAAGYVEIPGAQHELMMEADVYRDQFWAAFDAFIPGQD
ncbi:alpha/beta hydrolase [Polymorphum gilvum]|uniref:Alpha/beta hydrolase fold protein n=1 Tax=Polymorphum gilvum (strain LMG 25793 / CGMCC 1.9160 / SL003B-26A1) TaxID=991905 RepID=F2IWI7_POLGS|nr:alpha/beta hydrolase [Polymorphum gilvum]ADZ69286.1 Alpha/beta hydrolase fold protein [Polymorphum gilvum SL003B-26A1]